MTPGRLSGQTALVTGAARRLGREVSLALAERGVNIVVHYRHSQREAERLCRKLESRKVKAWPIPANFEGADETETLIERARAAAGRLDILVNSASTFPVGTLADMKFSELMTCVRVNAWTPFILSRDFARRAGRGKIVNLLDTRLDGSDPRHAAYILSKQMLHDLTLMTAAELGPSFTVNAVAPGLILPPPGKDEGYLRALARSVPLARHGAPADVAQAVIYLLEADYVTGQVIYVDGGRHVKELSPRSHLDRGPRRPVRHRRR